MTVLQELNENGVRLKVLTLDFDSQTPMGRFVFAMMGAFAQFKRETIHQRSIRGLQKARERGVIGGAAPRWTDKQILSAVKQHGTYDKAAKALKCSRITIIRRMEKMHKTRKAKKAKAA
jgi:DNA invertase Pin-like site-specific DNA recombinase